MDGGVIVRAGARPEEVIGNPKEERTRTFLRRVLDPTHLDTRTTRKLPSQGSPCRPIRQPPGGLTGLGCWVCDRLASGLSPRGARGGFDNVEDAATLWLACPLCS